MPQNPSINAVCNLEETNVKVCYPIQASSGGVIQSVVGGTDISVDNTDPLNPIVNYIGVTSTPDLQAVLTSGNTSTGQNINLYNGSIDIILSSQYSHLSGSGIGSGNTLNNTQALLQNDGSLVLNNGTEYSILKNTNVTSGNLVTLEFPDKATGSYTIATVDDISGFDLQTVTNAGSTTTNSMSVVNAGISSSDITQTYFLTQNLVTNAYTAIGSNGYIEFGNGSTSSFIKNTNATAGNLTTLQIPDKATGDYTIATTADLTGGTVTSISTSGLISGGTITTSGTISTSMNTNRLVGRSTALVGEMEEISIGTGLTLSGGTLSATGGAGGIQHATATGTDTYAATITGVTAYNDGDAYLIRFTNGNTTSCTLDINGLGAVSLYRNNDGALIGGDIWDGGEMLCIYNSTLGGFQCIGTSPNSLFAYVTNADSVTINKGQPVYAFGAAGNRMSVKLANNTTDATSAKTVGIVYSTSIATNQKGIIIIQGMLEGLSSFPLSTWADGDTVYLGSTAGAITPTKQYAPNHLVYLGVVTTASNGAAGRMYVRVQNGYELDELHNVQAQTPSLNDTLYYDSSVSPGQWKTASIATILGYTPQAQLNGTGFVKVSGTTVSYDNSTYLTSSAIGVTVQGYSASTTLLGNTTTGSGTTLVLSTSPTFTTSIITPTVTGVTGALTFTNAAQSSGAVTDYTFTSAAHTAQTASTEIVGVNYNLSATVQHATGAITTQRDFLIQARTHSFVGASTITSAGTLVVSAAPIAGTNATITNKYSIWSQSGNIFFQDANSNDFRFGAGLGGNTTLSTIWLKQGTSPSSTNYSMAYLNSITYINAPTSGSVNISVASIDMVSISNSAMTITDAKNIAVGTSTGTKIGTTTSQKIGFWNKTPIVQPTTAVTAATPFAANTSGIANDTATFGGYTIGQIVAALKNIGLLA